MRVNKMAERNIQKAVCFCHDWSLILLSLGDPLGARSISNMNQCPYPSTSTVVNPNLPKKKAKSDAERSKTYREKIRITYRFHRRQFGFFKHMHIDYYHVAFAQAQKSSVLSFAYIGNVENAELRNC